jgi:hypothetical protein
MLSQWATVARGRAIEVLPRPVSPENTVPLFLKTLGVPDHRCSLPSGRTVINASDDPLEHLYYPTLFHWTHHWINVYRRPGPPIPIAVINRYIALATQARPCFELAQRHRDQFDRDRLGLYDASSCTVLRKYVESWLSAVEGLLSGDLGLINRSSAESIIAHLGEARRELHALREDNPQPMLFPTDDFSDRLPLEGEIVTVSRVLAKGFLLSTETPALFGHQP